VDPREETLLLALVEPAECFDRRTGPPDRVRQPSHTSDEEAVSVAGDRRESLEEGRNPLLLCQQPEISERRRLSRSEDCYSVIGSHIVERVRNAAHPTFGPRQVGMPVDDALRWREQKLGRASAHEGGPDPLHNST
jgi:hypothetical protein